MASGKKSNDTYLFTKKLLIEHAATKPGFAHAFIHLSETPVREDDDPLTNRDIRVTNGVYRLQYVPVSAKTGAHRKKAFVISADVLSPYSTIRVAAFHDLECEAKHRPDVAWLIANTNISQRLFDVAVRNINMPVPFCLDYGEYAEKVGSYLYLPASIAHARELRGKIGIEIMGKGK